MSAQFHNFCIPSGKFWDFKIKKGRNDKTGVLGVF